jgi:serine/threonine protein kinase
MDNISGYVLNNKYIVLDFIGSGTSANVWRVVTLEPRGLFVIKIHKSNYKEDGEKEDEYLDKFKCKHVLKKIESFIHKHEEKEYYCIVLELMFGSLYDLMKKYYPDGLPYEFVKKSIKSLCLAIREVHNKKYIHTDIKPENLLVSGSIDDEKIKKVMSKEFTKLIEKHKKNKKSNKNAIKSAVYEILKKNNSDKDKSDSMESEETLSEYSSSVGSSDVSTIYSDEENIYEYKREDFDEESDDDFEYTLIDNKKEFSQKEINELCNRKIKLSDFGLVLQYTGKRMSYNIQTRYYRAPEVIMKSTYDYKCDVWSIGCTVYELLTGKMLFDPKRSLDTSTDRDHINSMQYILGPISKKIIDKSENVNKFLRKDGLLKGIIKQKYKPLKIYLEEKITNLKKDELELVTDFIANCLVYDNEGRYSIDDCINHAFLK